MKKYLGLKLNTKGSGIVTVMVAVVFLTILGSMLLMYSLTNFEMKATDRKGKQNSYDAETCMNEIVSGLQLFVSEATDDSLKKVLSDYGSNSGTNIQLKFAGKYKDYFEAKSNGLLNKSSKQYDVEYIAALLKNSCGRGKVYLNTYSDDEEFNASIDGKENSSLVPVSQNIYIRYFGSEYKDKYNPLYFCEEEEVNEDQLLKNIVLKNVSVTYVGDNFSNTVTTDISVGVPDVNELAGMTSVNNAKNCALIVGGKLNSNLNALYVQGSTYASEINTSAGGRVVFANNPSDRSYSVVVKDGVNIGMSTLSDTESFKTENKVILWAKNINIGNAAKVSLKYITNVANDLNISGVKSEAKISGEYFGFGSSLTDSDKSSSIIVNDKNSKLIFDELNTLRLTGFSFVAPNDVYYKMDESVSTKELQRLYLVPAEHVIYNKDSSKYGISIGKFNPKDGYDEVNDKKVTLTDDVLWTVNDNGTNKPMTYSDYNASVTSVVGLKNGDNSNKIVYYFLKFNSLTDSNNYFRDFAKYSKEKNNISDYISKYVEIIGGIRSNETVGRYIVRNDSQSEGKTVSKYELVESLTLDDEIKLLRDKGNDAQIEFENYCKYFSSVKPDSEIYDPENPYYYFVNYNKIHTDFKGSSSTPVIKTYQYASNNESDCSAVIIDMMDDKDKLGNFELKFNNGSVVFENKTINGVEGDYSYDNVGIIICNGNLSISGSGTFEGMILCAGNLDVSGEITIKNVDSTASKIKKAFNSFLYGTTDNNLSFRNYLNVVLASAISEGTSGEGHSSNITSLVKYKNWKKN